MEKSMRFKFGEEGGHFSFSLEKLFFLHSWTAVLVWAGALSCRKTYVVSENVELDQGSYH